MLNGFKALINDKLKRRYLIINLIVLTGLTVEFVLFKYGCLKIIRYLILLESLFIIAWKDKNEKIIPNKYLLIMTGIRMVLLICEWIIYSDYAMAVLLGSLMGMLIGALVFGICYLISRGGMGAGDVKLIAVLGFYLGGSDIMFTMILIVVSSAVYSLIKLAKKQTTLKEEVPFGPFVLIGTILAMALGV